MRIGQSYIKAYTDKVKSNQSVYGQKLNQSQMRIQTKLNQKNQMRIRTKLNQIKAYTDKS